MMFKHTKNPAADAAAFMARINPVAMLKSLASARVLDYRETILDLARFSHDLSAGRYRSRPEELVFLQQNKVPTASECMSLNEGLKE